MGKKLFDYYFAKIRYWHSALCRYLISAHIKFRISVSTQQLTDFHRAQQVAVAENSTPNRAMKTPPSFFGSLLVAVIRSTRSFPNPAAALSSTSINLPTKSSPRLFWFCCDYRRTFGTLMTRRISSTLSAGVTFGAPRALSSLDSGEMKQPSLYEVLVRKLYMTNMFNPVKLGLKNMEELHNLMNKPMDRVSPTLWFVSMSPPPSPPCIFALTNYTFLLM